jgi:hypothetical protein
MNLGESFRAGWSAGQALSRRYRLVLLLATILRCFLIFVGILCLLVAWQLVKAYWAPLMLITFLIVGIAVTVLYNYSIYRVTWTLSRDSLFVANSEGFQSKPTLGRIRLCAEGLLVSSQILTGLWINPLRRWVWNQLSRRRSPWPRGLIGAAATSSLEDWVSDYASTGLVLVLVAYGIAYVAPAQMHWARAFLILMAIQTMARHVQYLIGFRSLPVQLRRSFGKPYISFVIVAVTDLLSLVLVLNAILNWNGNAVASWEGIWNVLTRLYFAKFWELVRGLLNGNVPSLADVLLTLAGLLYNTTLLKTLWKFKDFRRTDEDYAYRAKTYRNLGRYADALKELERIPSDARTHDTYSLRADAYVGMSELDSAWDDCERILSSKEIEPTEQRTLFILAEKSELPCTGGVRQALATRYRGRFGLLPARCA